jgi:hypothetical protein
VKRILVFSATLIIALALLLYHNIAPRGTTIVFPANKTALSIVTVPLDSRPPCTDFTTELGHLAGFNVILPPAYLLDKYEIPAQEQAVAQWLKSNLPKNQGAIIAIDLLAHGGLLNSRLQPLPDPKATSILTFLKKLKQDNVNKFIYVYSIIPRLLVSDQILPDSWYQWHLMRWAILMDKKIQGADYDQEQYQELQAEIPAEIKWKYIKLYKENASFNKKLTNLAVKENFTDLVIGQDDAQPFGLPNHNRLNIEEYIATLPVKNSFHVTQGADELGALAVARIFSKNNNYKPKIYVEYGTNETSELVLPFVPLTLQDIVADKVKLINGSLVASKDSADFILFIHCGNNNHLEYSAIADKVKSLMAEKPLALVDLTMNFEGAEALLPHLIANNTPLAQLTAYAGWNTASNSIGTALAQATIFTGRIKTLPAESLPSLYAENLKFNCARFLDDWAYQKLIRHKISLFSDYNGIDKNSTTPYTNLVEGYINRELTIYNNLLLITNLRRFPFYKDANALYYLQDLTFQATLPWERTFEIRLNVMPSFGKLSLTNN